MKKYNFFNDYTDGGHPNILRRLAESPRDQEPGYGEDSYSIEAARKIKKILAAPTADIHFISGGTQANLIIPSSILRPHESIIAATTAHINVHEAGAIEATGHKIHTVQTEDGKLLPEHIEPIVLEHNFEHMVKPKLVHVANTTELGSVYSKKELQELRKTCDKHNLYLCMDGARIGSALCAADDLSFSDLPKLFDALYIGGTKNGALLGEAIVLVHDDFKTDFRYHIKQRGGLLAKGRVLGIQFCELFENSLFLELAQHANDMANKLADGIKAAGYQFETKPASNQIFPIFPNTVIETLEKKYGFYHWQKIDEEKTSVRLVTSWATDETKVDEFLKDLQS